MKLRVYIDTSVIGGCLDEKFRDVSKELIHRFEQGEMVAVVSELTVLELEDAPPQVRTILDKIPREHIEYVELTEEATELAYRYIDEEVIGISKLVDAEHMAIATISRVDVVVS